MEVLPVKRLLIVLVLTVWPSVGWTDKTQAHVEDTFDAMAWCLPPEATPASTVNVLPQTGEEWLDVDVNGFNFSLTWQPQPAPLNFMYVPHWSDQRLLITFPHRFARFSGEPTAEEDDLSRVFTLMTIGCFSVSDAI